MKTLLFVCCLYFLRDFDNRVSSKLNNRMLKQDCVVSFPNIDIDYYLFNDTISEEKIISDIIENIITIDYSYNFDNTLIIEEPGRGYIEMNFMNNTLYKATTRFSHSSGAINSISDFYFWEDKVIYIVQQNEYNTTPKYYTGQETLETEEKKQIDESTTIIKVNKYFFHNEELIKWINEKNEEDDSPSMVIRIIIKNLLWDANNIIEKSKKY